MTAPMVVLEQLGNIGHKIANHMKNQNINVYHWHNKMWAGKIFIQRECICHVMLMDVFGDVVVDALISPNGCDVSISMIKGNPSIAVEGFETIPWIRVNH